MLYKLRCETFIQKCKYNENKSSVSNYRCCLARNEHVETIFAENKQMLFSVSLLLSIMGVIVKMS